MLIPKKIILIISCAMKLEIWNNFYRYVSIIKYKRRKYSKELQDSNIVCSNCWWLHEH